MSDENLNFELRRLEFIKSCAYYVVIKNIPMDQLKMTQDLADLITERFRLANMEWSIGNIPFYNKLLNDAMQEKLPNFDGGEHLYKSSVLRYSFKSLVAKEVETKKQLLGSLQKMVSNKDENGNELLCKTSSKSAEQRAIPSAAPHDFLIGFTVQIKPDVHLDEMIPICARDQHLLYNIFGEKWKSSVVIDAYKSVKGQTGFMHNWLSNHNKKSGENSTDP